MTVPSGRKLSYFLFSVLTVSSELLDMPSYMSPAIHFFFSEDIGCLVKKHTGSHGGQSWYWTSTLDRAPCIYADFITLKTETANSSKHRQPSNSYAVPSPTNRSHITHCEVIWWWFILQCCQGLILHRIRWQGEWLIINWRDWEGSSHDVTEVLLRYLPGGTERNHKKLQPGQFVFHKVSNQTFPAKKSRILPLHHLPQWYVTQYFQKS
jgi:hypothetical protein